MALALVVVWLIGCDPAGSLGPEEPVASVVVTPTDVELVSGDTTRLAAQPRNAAGRPLQGRVVTWTSNRTDIATVDSAGLVRAVGEGTARITAASGGMSSHIVTRVVPVPVASVDAEPTSATLEVGDTVRLVAVARDAGGAPLEGRAFVYSSNRTDVATVDVAGLITARGPGAAVVTVSSGGKSATVSVSVGLVAPVVTRIEPTSIQAGWGNFTLVVRGSGFASGAKVLWNGSPLESFVYDPTDIRATVTSAHVATPGSVEISVETAAPESLRSNAMTFTVFERPAHSVEIRVAGNAVFVGTATRIDAIARDQFGQTIANKTITWSVSDTTVARISGGAVHGLKTGPVVLTANAYPTSASITFGVLAAPSSDVVFEAAPSGYPELFVRSLAPGAALRRLFAPGTYGGQAAVSADGQRIAFVGRDGANLDIYVVQRDGTGLVRLTTNSAIDDQPAWSPDGQWLAFRSFRDGKSDIWIMRADGSQQTNLTYAAVFVPEEYNDAPAWSPDGQRIAFSRGFGTGQAIVTVRPDGSELSELVALSNGFDHTEPAWSPNGQLIAYRTRNRSTGEGRVALASAVTGEPSYVWLGLVADAASPAWLSDDWLAVTSRAHPGSSVRTISVVRLGAGYEVVPLGPEFGELGHPVGIPR